MSEHHSLIDSLRGKIERALKPHLAHHPPVALLDFPDHHNVGDSAIWLGELVCLKNFGIRPRYTSDLMTCNLDHLARRVGGGTILLSGGGNLGDVWERNQLFRERVITAFPDNPIVQLPQSVFFEDQQALERARAVFNKHEKLTLFCRDRRSLEIAKAEFDAPSHLCPDMAFCLGPLERTVEPSIRHLWLARTDKEAIASDLPESADVTTRVDWLSREPTALASFDSWAIRRVTSRHSLEPLFRLAMAAYYSTLARQRLDYGLRLLSSAHTVITDRLHGHILCLLLGIPQILMDTSYGKVRAFFETWTSGTDLTRWSGSPAEALSIAAHQAKSQTGNRG
jgi:pyruvyl transferase EpsO